jgi:hypothetical protein
MNAADLDTNQDNIPPVGVIGRFLRTIIGGFQLYFVWSAVTYFSALRSIPFENQPLFWTVAALGIYFLPWAINLGFRKVLRINRQWWFGALALGALAAVGWNYLHYQSALQPALSSYLMVAAIYAHGHIGISNLLAGIVGIRGCEMRVIPFLIQRLAGSDTELVLCPGAWTPLDRWEAGLRQENR